MQTRIAIMTLCLLAGVGSAFAQNFSDALRYSYFQPLGTARFIATGSAMGPLGVDYSVISTNPAGLAWMRKSELMFTPGFSNSRQRATLNDPEINNREFLEKGSRFVFPNAGMVIATSGNYNWRTINFAFGVTRLADFNNQLFFRGNSQGTIVDRFVEQANSDIGLDPFEAGLAYDAQALIEDSDGTFFSDFELAPRAIIQREQQVERSGGITELSFGLAGNYRERVMWGLSVGIPIVNYQEEKAYREVDANGEVPFFDNLEFNENLNTSGVGANLKLGVIVRPTQALRLGFAVHTPTAYQFSDTFSTDMVYNYTFDNEARSGQATSPEGSFQYKLRTPWRFMGGAGLIIAKNGFLSGEVEFVDYGRSNFRYDDFPEDQALVNQNIEDNLGDAVNLRLGGEYTVGNFQPLRIGEEYAVKRLNLRAGINAQSNIELADDDGWALAYNAGAGIRGRTVYFDFAYRWQTQAFTYIPYRTVAAIAQPSVSVDGVNTMVVFTLGFRF